MYDNMLPVGTLLIYKCNTKYPNTTQYLYLYEIINII